MSGVFCIHCGGENPPQAEFCQYCGKSMAMSPSPPILPSPVASAPQASWLAATPYATTAPPPPPRPRRWGRIVVAIVAVILILGVIFLFLAPSPNVIVTGINFSSPDDACGLNGATDYGFNASSGTSMQFTYQLSGNNTTDGGTSACTINSLTTSTPGFSISGANVPLAIPANSTQLLSFSVNMPSSSYTGILTFVLT
jgi:hypothetical protein